MKKVFFGKIQNGIIKLYRTDEYKKVVYSLEGEDIAMSIGKKTRDRSDNQNRYYWGVVVDLVSVAMGENDKDVAHEYLKTKFAKDVIVVNTKTGVEFVEIVRSTATMKTFEFENYLSRIRTWASIELGVAIPEPNQIDIINY